ncbi:UDP-glucose 4-epimerase family protein [Methylovulum miyakonense]|uniref:UDP-glucose 4-epimerase family protein n=1 Tax=Methylovulum miyakonense TaxID=645578 RepID=UPI000369C35C|nr:SDR family oxidoreductase [Methylovulum miyakonense]
MDTVLVTGATGFVGKALCSELMAKGFSVNGIARKPVASGWPGAMGQLVIGDINGQTVWRQVLGHTGSVVHLAARTHVLHDTAADALAEYRNINVAGTLNLARQAAAMGVKRFVFVSSVKVNGENTPSGQPFTEDAAPAPLDAYGMSKCEAEAGLRQLALETGMEVVIIRPPLVYGPGVKANFRTLMRYVDKRVPLPFALIDNKRSLVALDNLVDMVTLCLSHPAAANQTFLVSDGHDVSTADLLRRLAMALNKPALLFPVPVGLLAGGLRLSGKGAVAQRLCGNLQVDIAKARELLAWAPRVGLDEALGETARHYQGSR